MINMCDLYVTTAYGWFSAAEREKEYNKGTKKVEKEAELVSDILAAQISLYLMRRTVGVCGSIIDHTRGILSKAIKAYEKEFGEYRDFNEDVDY